MECTFPSVSLPDGCMVWWHLPVIAAAALTWLCLAFSYLSRLWKRHKERLRKRRETVRDELSKLELEMWDDEAGALEQFTSRVRPLGVRASEVAVKVQEIKKQQSERAGVSLRYLLSDEFSSLAQMRAEKANPTFNELKDVFWLGETPLGKNIICPRDGRPGCALVDWIPRKDRREQTHFMSWSWQYTLEQVCISLDMFRWIADSADADGIEYATFFFMDFFVNNQYRIFAESSNLLHEQFEHCLCRIGRMVVLLDDAWQDPAYFKRVWTVYEFHVALLKNVNVQFLLNYTSFSSLYEQVRNEAFVSGNCLFSHVDCCRAIDAPQDREFVHSAIRQTVGFDALNREARRYLQEMVQKIKSRDSPKLKNWLSSVDKVFAELEVQLWDDEAGALEQFTSRLQPLGVRASEVAVKVQEIKKQQSERAGVSLRYLLSDEFSSLAQMRAEKANPTFNELKDVFWLGETPLGEDIICPRDGRPGCALVDWIPRKDRREQTHFMSWSWQYTLGEVQSALEVFRSAMSVFSADVGVYFYMCFFVNNQFRIIVERSAAGSENLSNMFQQSLLRTGHMVAILDTWQNPVYLTRVWTIYEQFLACSQGLDVTLVMPEASMNSLQGQIFIGREGIREIIVSLSQVDSARAEAWDPKDATRVKSEIQRTVGFDEVNRHVVRAMVCWIGRVVQRQFQRLVDEEMVSNIEEDLVCEHV